MFCFFCYLQVFCTSFCFVLLPFNYLLSKKVLLSLEIGRKHCFLGFSRQTKKKNYTLFVCLWRFFKVRLPPQAQTEHTSQLVKSSSDSGDLKNEYFLRKLRTTTISLTYRLTERKINLCRQKNKEMYKLKINLS